jgi:glycosyltransferase involved in cell wall biosynthesis
MKKTDFLCFGGIDWWYHNRAHIDPQLTRRFARTGSTLFINSIVMQKFNIVEGRKFIQKLIRKTRSIITGLKKTEEGFWVYSPFSLPVHHLWGARRINEIILRAQIWFIMRRLGIRNPLVLVACPAACDVALKMKKSKLLYQRTDRFEESPGVDVETIKEYDQKLKKNADLTYFVNRLLYAEESKQCKKALFLGHGVDYDMFASAEKNQETPHDIVDIPKPIIGYFGEINAHSFDFVLAEKIAELLPDMSFVYIGSVTSDCTGLKNKKNVWMLGQREYEQIPHYGKCFDVAILPWVKNRWTEAANPIKVKEYLAMGKPFVSTPVFSEVEKYLNVTYIAETPEEFADCIRKALVEDCPELVAKRRQKVIHDTWDSKAEFLLRELSAEDKV